MDTGSKLGLDSDSKLGLDTGSKLGLDTGSKLGLDTGSKLGLDTGCKLGKFDIQFDNKIIFLDPSILFLVFYTSFSMSGPGN